MKTTKTTIFDIKPTQRKCTQSKNNVEMHSECRVVLQKLNKNIEKLEIYQKISLIKENNKTVNLALNLRGRRLFQHLHDIIEIFDKIRPDAQCHVPKCRQNQRLHVPFNLWALQGKPSILSVEMDKAQTSLIARISRNSEPISTKFQHGLEPT
ncbi:MAG: hypothetical protein GY820_00285 [Gammaproteobacteria bacterium]|nr:hypothetical protein [Gammaproteobacteria bacterium]